MLTRPRSRARWWLLGLALAAAALLLLNSGSFSPLRGFLTRLTLPAQRALRQAGTDVREVTASINDLATLRTRNAELEQLVAELTVDNVRLREVEAENARLRSLLAFSEANPGYGLMGSQIVGRVVADDPNNTIRSILIDLGSRNGVKVGMPVVTERGLVGRIVEVYFATSRVLLITDSNSSVNVVLQNARLRGILRGRAGLSTIMDYIPQNEPMTVGDIVVTSGEGGAFPKGIPVGQVVEIQQNDVQMFQVAIVRTTVDFSTLETILVVTSFVPIEDLGNLPQR